MRISISEDKERSYNGDYMTIGKRAEDLVINWLRNRPTVKKVVDMRPHKALQEADIDIIIEMRGGPVLTAEIKSDRHLGVSGNVLFELLRINHTTSITERAVVLGWTAKTPAQYLLIYAPAPHAIYKCRFTDFRSKFQEYSHKQRKNTELKWINTDAIKSTLNAVIPFDFCRDIFEIYYIGESL